MAETVKAYKLREKIKYNTKLNTLMSVELAAAFFILSSYDLVAGSIALLSMIMWTAYSSWEKIYYEKKLEELEARQ